MLAVEAAMRRFARKTGADEEQWGVAGLLHDFDYEQHPDEHPLWGMALLESLGVDPAIIRAIASHYAEKTGVQPESPIEKTLFAVDELSGFITAVAYVRPSRKVGEVEVKSVVKKLKTSAFAAAVKREDIALGAEMLGLSQEELIAEVLAAMQDSADALGL
jgi:putative nucleotidyltransferase with HDIG domain